MSHRADHGRTPYRAESGTWKHRRAKLSYPARMLRWLRRKVRK